MNLHEFGDKMGRRLTALLSVSAVVLLQPSLHGGVFDDAKVYFRGPVDANGDNVVDPGEYRDSFHYGTADVCFFTVFAVNDGNRYIIRSFKTVGYDYLTSGSNGIETVDVCAVQMLERMLSAARIESVAIRQKRKSAKILYHIRNRLGIVGS